MKISSTLLRVKQLNLLIKISIKNDIEKWKLKLLKIMVFIKKIFNNVF